MDTLVLILTLRNKDREGILLLTSLIKRLNTMPLLKAEYTSLIN